jgi:hypothetical protein
VAILAHPAGLINVCCRACGALNAFVWIVKNTIYLALTVKKADFWPQ